MSTPATQRSTGTPAPTIHVRDAIRALPAYVPGARPGSDDVAKLSSNELPFPAQDAVVEAVARAAREVNRYPQMAGDSLVEALATRYAEHGITPEQVVVGTGSVALIQHVLDTVCDEGDEVVLPWRSFEAYPICIAVAGATAVKVPVTADGRHDVPAMLAAITPRTRVVMACSPNNPTGPALTAAELRQLADGVPEDVLLLVDEAYPICIAVAGATAVKVPVTADGRHDVPAMLAAITPRTRVVMACSPNNPTGPALTAAELRQLADGVPEDVLLLVDEAYLDFVTDDAVGDALDLLAEHPNLVVSRTFSKAHALAGMRVGYLIAEPGIIAAIRAVATPFGVSLPAQAAAVAALEPEVLAETARRAGVVAAERDRVVAVLRERGWTVPDAQGNFYWLAVGEETAALNEHLTDAGVLARPFVGDGVRVSVGTTADDDRLLAALDTWTGSRA